MATTKRKKAKRGGFEATTDFFGVTAEYGRCTVRTCIVDAAGWKALKAGDRARWKRDGKGCDWAGVTMEDGRILATRLEAGGSEDNIEAEVRGKDDPEPPEWIEATRKLRAKLLTLLEEDDDVSWLDLHVGGDGKGYFDVTYGEAELRVALVINPNG